MNFNHTFQSKAPQPPNPFKQSQLTSPSQSLTPQDDGNTMNDNNLFPNHHDDDDGNYDQNDDNQEQSSSILDLFQSDFDHLESTLLTTLRHYEHINQNYQQLQKEYGQQRSEMASTQLELSAIQQGLQFSLQKQEELMDKIKLLQSTIAHKDGLLLQSNNDIQALLSAKQELKTSFIDLDTSTRKEITTLRRELDHYRNHSISIEKQCMDMKQSTQHEIYGLQYELQQLVTLKTDFNNLFAEKSGLEEEVIKLRGQVSSLLKKKQQHKQQYQFNQQCNDDDLEIDDPFQDTFSSLSFSRNTKSNAKHFTTTPSNSGRNASMDGNYDDDDDDDNLFTFGNPNPHTNLFSHTPQSKLPPLPIATHMLQSRTNNKTNRVKDTISDQTSAAPVKRIRKKKQEELDENGVTTTTIKPQRAPAKAKTIPSVGNTSTVTTTTIFTDSEDESPFTKPAQQTKPSSKQKSTKAKVPTKRLSLAKSNELHKTDNNKRIRLNFYDNSDDEDDIYNENPNDLDDIDIATSPSKGRKKGHDYHSSFSSADENGTINGTSNGKGNSKKIETKGPSAFQLLVAQKFIGNRVNSSPNSSVFPLDSPTNPFSHNIINTRINGSPTIDNCLENDEDQNPNQLASIMSTSPTSTTTTSITSNASLIKPSGKELPPPPNVSFFSNHKSTHPPSKITRGRVSNNSSSTMKDG